MEQPQVTKDVAGSINCWPATTEKSAFKYECMRTPLTKSDAAKEHPVTKYNANFNDAVFHILLRNNKRLCSLIRIPTYCNA